MPGVISRGIQAVRAALLQATVGVREERVVRYMLNEMQKGKPYDQIVGEAYVVNHTTAESRARLVENPRILGGIEDQLAGGRYTYTVDYATVRAADKSE